METGRDQDILTSNLAPRSSESEASTLGGGGADGEHAPAPPPASPGVIDPRALRLGQDFEVAVGVKKALKTVPVRKPTRFDWFRVHRSPDYQLRTGVLELKEERETYLVSPVLWGTLSAELQPVQLFTTVNRQGVVALWPVKLPRSDGRSNPWNDSAMEAASMAMREWISLRSNMSMGGYDIYRASAVIPEPAWPDESFAEILNVAFKGHFITDADHAVLRRLRGEV